MTIRELEKTFITALVPLYGLEEARNIAWLDISFVCGFNRLQYLVAKEDELPQRDQDLLLSNLDELKTGKPLQYVLGETEFYGLPFRVNPAVLIPRPETEELVDWIIKDTQKEIGDSPREGFSILDMGTGSGCIPVSLKRYLPEASVFALDISEGALETAVNNSVLNKTEVHFFKDDMLDPRHVEIVSRVFNLIVSNPPYVTVAEKDQMHENVLFFEPHTALFVSNEDPLQFYRAITGFARSHLKANGKLFLEINENLGDATVQLLAEMGFINVELRMDLRGKHRMIKASFPKGD